MRRGGGYCSICFPLPPLGCQLTHCPAEVWANPHTPQCPSGPRAVTSTKPGPSTDRKVNSNMIGHSKWIRAGTKLALIVCLTPTIQDFSTNHTDPAPIHFSLSKATLLRAYLVWVHTWSFSQAPLSAKAELISVRSRLLLYPAERKSLLQSTFHLILKKVSTSISSFPSLAFLAPLGQIGISYRYGKLHRVTIQNSPGNIKEILLAH